MEAVKSSSRDSDDEVSRKFENDFDIYLFLKVKENIQNETLSIS